MSPRETSINTTLQKAATIWQLLFGIGSVLVTVTVFVLSLRADINTNKAKIDQQKEAINAINTSREKIADKSELNQKEILEKLGKIELEMSNKQNRK